MDFKTIAPFLVALLVALTAVGIAIVDDDSGKTVKDEQYVLTLTCDIADNVKVTMDGKEYKAGDKLVLTDDAQLQADSLAGTVNIEYETEWNDTSGFHNKETGSEYGQSMTIYIDFMCYGQGTGTLKVWSEPDA